MALESQQVSQPEKSAWQKLLILFLLPFGLMFIAMYLYYFGQGLMQSGHNRGELIMPPLDISDLDMRDAEGQLIYLNIDEEYRLKAKEDINIRPWLMVYLGRGECMEICQRQIYEMRQIHTGLGKDANRLQRFYVDFDTYPEQLTLVRQWLKEKYQQMLLVSGSSTALHNGILQAEAFKQQHDVKPIENHWILLIDPLGNMMMYYTKVHTANQILKDLQFLLKKSTIG